MLSWRVLLAKCCGTRGVSDMGGLFEHVRLLSVRVHVNRNLFSVVRLFACCLRARVVGLLPAVIHCSCVRA